MTLNFYTLGVLYLVYSFLGWVGETVVATFRGKRFANLSLIHISEPTRHYPLSRIPSSA